MIKRYDACMENYGEIGNGIYHKQHRTGEWVRYEDIKDLIPDNRVTEKELRYIFFKLKNGSDFVKYAKEKGWIK